MIAVGVDTHKERHYAVALDQVGQLLAELSFAATAAGYAELQHWAERLVDAPGLVFGLEGAGSWGAGLCQHLQHAGYSVLEVERPRRKDRRAGKSDRIDALAAAKCVLTGENISIPRRRGILTAIRALLIARRSAVTERTRVLNQLQALNATAPIALRERIGEGTGKQLERRILSMRARSTVTLEERIAFSVMRDLAAHSRTLGVDAKRYEHQLAALIRSLDATLLDEPGIGPISAAKLLAFDPTRFTSEGAFARCNGTAPIPASSGKTIRHRLNRGGDRQANNAIHTIAIIRAKHQPETRAYLERRTQEGKTKREALRSLKRHISRELYQRLNAIPLTS
ncbi:MAG: IS110 family transposase [Actinobacteria bacterium]|nr:IS110 family transposase [Actinomycetota bacterium]